MHQRFAAQYQRLEQEHYWHQARREIILSTLKRYFPRRPSQVRPRLLDVGCGAGVNLRHFQSLFDSQGIEPNTLLAQQARQATDLPILSASLPLTDGKSLSVFDCITLLDVLEHIKDDAAALVSLVPHLKPNGLFLLNVPAHPLLWSALDDANLHFRRYTRRSLTKTLHRAGLQPIQMRYWASIATPFVLIHRYSSWRHLPADQFQMTIPSAWLNTVARLFLLGDYWATAPLHLPFGVSLLVAARRRY